MKSWLSEIWMIGQPILSREDFVKKYFPQYVRPYESPTGIRMVRGVGGRLHVQMPSNASKQAQITKRENRIDAAYSEYTKAKKFQMEVDRQHTEPTLPGLDIP